MQVTNIELMIMSRLSPILHQPAAGLYQTTLTDCTISAPSVGQSGAVIWTFTGTLAPGKSGTVTYQVTIEN
jgi:hypothetical protein